MKYYKLCVLAETIVFVKAESKEKAEDFALKDISGEAFDTSDRIVSADTIEVIDEFDEDTQYVYDSTVGGKQ